MVRYAYNYYRTLEACRRTVETARDRFKAIVWHYPGIDYPPVIVSAQRGGDKLSEVGTFVPTISESHFKEAALRDMISTPQSLTATLYL